MTKILLTGDMHTGSLASVSVHAMNTQQRHINKKWNEMAKDQFPVDYLVLMGDMVDGSQPASKGKDLWTADVDRQIDAAIELVNRIDYDKLVVVYGTPYHTSENLNADQIFAKTIGADKHDWEINLQPKGTNATFHLSHTISVSASSWQYRTTPIAKELVAALLNERELYKYTGIFRGHAHYHVYVRFGAFGVIVPCWQGRTSYTIRKGLSLIPKLGYVTLENEGDNNWAVGSYLFDILRPELVVL